VHGPRRRADTAPKARGEAPFGIVYQTDAAVEQRVKVVGAFPPNSYPPVVYPLALTAGSTNPDAALLVQYLRGAEARALFEKQGFSVLSTSP
jgi:molybdate transport system substrate-binding protein